MSDSEVGRSTRATGAFPNARHTIDSAGRNPSRCGTNATSSPGEVTVTASSIRSLLTPPGTRRGRDGLPGESDVASLPADIPVERAVEGPVKAGGAAPAAMRNHWWFVG